MKLKRWMILTLLIAPISGCVTTTGSYCDITSPLLFDSQRTVDWLLRNDRALLVEIIIHNEQNKRICH